MSPRVYSAYVRLFQKYSRLYRGIQPQKSFPSLFNPSPRRVFLSFFFSLFAEKWSRILYIHRSFQEWILTYKTPSTEACIPRNKRVSPFPPDGYKDLTISNSEGGRDGNERCGENCFGTGPRGEEEGRGGTNAARRQIS